MSSACSSEPVLRVWPLATSPAPRGVWPNTLSANLNVLAGAGLISSRRDGRSIIYAAGYDRMRELLAFLMEDCCGGNAEICAPLAAIAERAACCA